MTTQNDSMISMFKRELSAIGAKALSAEALEAEVKDKLRRAFPELSKSCSLAEIEAVLKVNVYWTKSVVTAQVRGYKATRVHFNPDGLLAEKVEARQKAVYTAVSELLKLREMMKGMV